MCYQGESHFGSAGSVCVADFAAGGFTQLVMEVGDEDCPAARAPNVARADATKDFVEIEVHDAAKFSDNSGSLIVAVLDAGAGRRLHLEMKGWVVHGFVQVD